jgi:hypothetical protein
LYSSNMSSVKICKTSTGNHQKGRAISDLAFSF